MSFSERLEHGPRQPDPEPVDVSSLTALRQLQRPDGPDRVGQIIARFLEESAQRLSAVRNAVDAHDPKALEASAHALKGIAGTVGANEVAEAARELEQIARTGSTTGADEQVKRLHAAWQRAMPVYEELRGGVNA